MNSHAHNTKAAVLLALALALAACSKQGEQPAVSIPAEASTPAFPAGNGDAAMTVADCDKLPNPEPVDDSATGRATAASQGFSARAACKKKAAAQQDKPNADLARIREIKEKEDAAGEARKMSEAEWRRVIKEGARQPIKEYTY